MTDKGDEKERKRRQHMYEQWLKAQKNAETAREFQKARDELKKRGRVDDE